MTDTTDSLILEHLRHIRAKVDRIADDVDDMKPRLTGVEEGLARLNRRVDRIETRLERIEQRLELVD